MRAILLTGPEALRSADVAEPDTTGKALVSIEQVGICGTDIKILHGDVPVDYPRILGHELVGRVLEPGPRRLVAAGTRVLIDPAVACGYCRVCRDDKPHLCPNGALMGRDVDGGLAERIAVDELQLHPLPDDLDPRVTALLQVLGTCVHGQNDIEIVSPDTAVVVGLGIAGILHVQLLRARGIREIIGIEISEPKRRLALELGATAVGTPAEAEALTHDRTGGAGASLVIEAVGRFETLGLAIRLAAIGGQIVGFGIIPARQGELPFYSLYHKELRLTFPRAARPRDYDRAIALAESGAVSLAALWARSYPLEQAAAAFGELTPDILKVTLEG